MEVSAARAQGAVRLAEIFAAFVEAAEFLFLSVCCVMVEGGGIVTLERLSTSFEPRTSKRDACPMACFLRVSISVAGKDDGASMGRYPGGKVSKAFCSSKVATDLLLAVLLMTLSSILFFGLPRFMIDASDSPRRWPIV